MSDILPFEEGVDGVSGFAPFTQLLGAEDFLKGRSDSQSLLYEQLHAVAFPEKAKEFQSSGKGRKKPRRKSVHGILRHLGDQDSREVTIQDSENWKNNCIVNLDSVQSQVMKQVMH